MTDEPGQPKSSHPNEDADEDARVELVISLESDRKDGQVTVADVLTLERWLTADRELREYEGFRVTRRPDPKTPPGMSGAINEILIGWATNGGPAFALALLTSLQSYRTNRKKNHHIVVKKAVSRHRVLVLEADDRSLAQLKKDAKRLAREWRDGDSE